MAGRAALTPETASALRDPHGVVHVMGFIAIRQIVGPACVPYNGLGREAIAAGWWHLSDVELLGPDAVVTCLWCAPWRR